MPGARDQLVQPTWQLLASGKKKPCLKKKVWMALEDLHQYTRTCPLLSTHTHTFLCTYTDTDKYAQNKYTIRSINQDPNLHIKFLRRWCIRATENPCSIPITDITTIYNNPNSMISNTIFWPLRAYIYTLRQNIQTHKIINTLKKKLMYLSRS